MKVEIHNGVPIKMWTDTIEPEAMQQLKNISSLPFLFRHLAVMPDVHAGYGSTIGSVIATKGAIIPSAVGVDIGCGMLALDLKTPLDSLNLKDCFDKITKAVPVGFAGHNSPNNIGSLKTTASERIRSIWNKAGAQMGTLGGGNHFIEICDDGEGNAWLMLHSGSRGTGNKLAQLHIKKAKQLMKIWHIDLLDPDLAYLVKDTPEFEEYIQDLSWCQQYAYYNRQKMMGLILNALNWWPHSPVINCHHNYTELENHFGSNVYVTRKGAVRAREGELGIIPGSMGTKSYIVRGLGNRESFCSCSHGAGRVMSRTKAKANYTTDDLEKQTEGVICRKDDGVLDEIPSAYKDLDVVMENQKDLVSIEKTLKAVVCVKG